jgi:hypothetical protein
MNKMNEIFNDRDSLSSSEGGVVIEDDEDFKD